MTIYSHTCIDRTPYTYLIGWSYLNKWYYGRRTAKGCHPSELWVKYFTSSSVVKELRLMCEPDIIEVRYCGDIDTVIKMETNVLKYLNCAASEYWLNKTNGDLKWHTTNNSLSPSINAKKGRRGVPKSQEHRDRIAESNRGIKKPRSTDYAIRRKEWIDSMSPEERRLKFANTFDDARKQELSRISSKGNYIFVSPSGETFEHHSIIQFAKIHNLSHTMLYKMVDCGLISDGKFGASSDKRKRTNGWEVRRRSH